MKEGNFKEYSIANTSYMNLTATNESTVEQGKSIGFDEIVSGGEGIRYMTGTQSVEFLREGFYYVSWWISIVDSTGVDFFSSALSDARGKILVAGTIVKAPSVDLSQLSLSGSRLIQVRIGERLNLKNIGAGTFRLSRENGYSGQMIIVEMREREAYISVYNKNDTELIPQGGIIKPDTVDFSKRISYEDGVFTVDEDGEYLVSWMCNLFTDNIYRGNLNYVVSLSTGGAQIITSGMKGSPGLGTLIVEGIGIIHLDKGETVELRNFSDSEMQFSTGNGNPPIIIAMFKL